MIGAGRARALASLGLVLAATACGGGRSTPDQAPATRMPRANVLLVTIDTLRADRVGAYGSTRGLTPTIDRLAAEGVRFETAYAHVPLTLPSHTTLMTGAYPFVNGVRDNGAFRFDGARPTIASTLKAAGYRTGAFVASFVLDPRFGLSMGFDVYDAAMRARSAGGDLSQIERPADAVVQAALGWLEASPSTPQPSTPAAPWFAWVHFYDPHDPYEAPEVYRTRAADDPYGAEVAFADAQLGVLLDTLRQRGALANTLVVVAADHGESLGEHGERTHGLFAYDATIRVPLVFWGAALTPAVVHGAARLVDVMPTVLDLVGVAAPAVSGRSLRTAVSSSQALDDQGVYLEALNANLTRHWAPLTGLVAGGLKFIDLPDPELYDLAADPGETRNLYASRQDAATPIARRLNALKAGAAPAAPQAVDRDTERRLRALGYVSSSGGPSRDRTYTTADDPKRLIGLHTSLEDALAAEKSGDVAKAERLLRELVTARADFTVAYDRLAQLYRDSGRLRLAIETLDRAATAGAADAASLAALGGYLQESGQLDRAIEVLETARQMNPAEMDVYEKLGITYTRRGRFDEAQRMFDHVLSASPNSPVTLNNLGSLYLSQGRWADATTTLTKALALDPTLANAHNGLGVAYAQQGQFEKAIAAWQRALQLRPDLADARDNIARARALMRSR